jgi:hypothetical protein
MSQIFHRSTNTISRVTIFGFVFLVAGLLWVANQVQRSSYITGVGDAVVQPVPFSHEHHVAGLGLDCRYCHTAVESSSFAGIPPTQTCMNCHSQIWADAPMLAPVRDSLRSGRPLTWVRVHNLPGFAYFDHSIHVHKGVGCQTCHGDVDRMPLIAQSASLQMDWCLACHRAPEQFVRPRAEVFNMRYQPPPDQRALGLRLVQEYGIRTPQELTSCSVCHR